MQVAAKVVAGGKSAIGMDDSGCGVVQVKENPIRDYVDGDFVD